MAHACKIMVEISREKVTAMRKLFAEVATSAGREAGIRAARAEVMKSVKEVAVRASAKAAREALLALAMVSMALTHAHTPNWWIVVTMILVGLGIGPTMGVGVTAIQNAVPAHMIGIGTASANMFRLIGGSVGTAAFGAIFAAGLQSQLGNAIEGSPRALTKEMIAAMDPAMQELVTQGIAAALHPVFWIACVLALLACAVSLMMIELPLQDRVPGQAQPQAQPAE